jgi:hypothetical protein
MKLDLGNAVLRLFRPFGVVRISIVPNEVEIRRNKNLKVMGVVSGALLAVVAGHRIPAPRAFLSFLGKFEDARQLYPVRPPRG